MDVKPRVFISYQYGTDIAHVLRLLEHLNFDVELSTELPSTGSELYRALKRSIRSCDVVISFVNDDANPNLIFELGVAVGLGKETLLVSDASSQIPESLRGLLAVAGSANDLSGIEFALRTFLSTKWKVRSTEKRAASRRASGTVQIEQTDTLTRKQAVETAIAALRDQDNVNGFDVERIVAALLRDLHLLAVESERTSKLGARTDFAVWDNALSSSVGNPLLVEVKSTIPVDAEGQLRLFDTLIKQRAGARASYILLLYVRGPRHPNIPLPLVSFRLDDFLQRLRDSSFAHVVQSRRNEIVHGRP